MPDVVYELIRRLSNEPPLRVALATLLGEINVETGGYINDVLLDVDPDDGYQVTFEHGYSAVRDTLHGDYVLSFTAYLAGTDTLLVSLEVTQRPEGIFFKPAERADIFYETKKLLG